jgi:hypothetical protein
MIVALHGITPYIGPDSNPGVASRPCPDDRDARLPQCGGPFRSATTRGAEANR